MPLVYWDSVQTKMSSVDTRRNCRERQGRESLIVSP